MEAGNTVKIDQFKRIQGATLILGEKRYPVFKGINTIGRNKIAIINIKHLNVSQNQAIIVVVDENQHFISDLNSSNGTFLHGAKLTPFKLYELINEVNIKFGDVEAQYFKVADYNTTVKLQETLEMTQNMTQNFYASNTQLVINTTTLNQSDEHNYSNVSIQKCQQSDVLDIHDMATQVEEYPQQFPAKVKFAKPIVKPSKLATVDECNSDIHNAPTQVITFKNGLSNSPKLGNKNIQEDAEEDVEATQVMKYPDRCNVPILTHKTASPFQNVENASDGNSSDQIEKQVSSEKSSSSSETTSERTQILNSQETTNMVNALNKISNNRQKTVAHNSQMPSTSGLSITGNCDPEDSFADITKNVGTQGVIDESLVQPGGNENSNDSMDFFTMQNIEESITSHSGNANEDVNSKGVSNSVSEITKQNNIGSPNIQLSSKLASPESGSETDIDSENEAPIRKKLKKLESEDENTQDICTKKKPLKKLDSDGDTDDTPDILCRKNKLLKKLTSSDTDSTQDICIKKKPLKKLVSDDSDSDSNDSPNKKHKFGSKSDSTPKNIDKDCISESETDCEEEINKKDVGSAGNTENTSKSNQAKSDDSETEIEDNNEEAAKSVVEKVMDDLQHRKDKSKLVDRSLNESDCIPATQDAFAEAFSYQSSKTPTNDNQSSEEESFKLGITQLMEDIPQNKSEESKDNSKPNNSIPTSKENDHKIAEESEVAKNDNIYLEPTQKINVVRDTHSLQEGVAGDPNSFKNDEVYFLPTQKINDDQDTQPDFKVPSKKFTFKKKTANLDNSLTKILSNNIENDDDVYMAATQQIDVSVPPKGPKCISVFEQDTQKLNIENNEDDVFLQATQCIDVDAKKNTKLSRDDDEVYFLPTQQITVQSKDTDTDEDGKRGQDEVYLVETQLLTDRANEGSKNIRESLEKISNQNKNTTDLPVIMNDMSMFSEDTQSEMPFSDENVVVVSLSNNSRPENPLVHVLNKDSKSEEMEVAKCDTSQRSSKSEIDISSPSRSKLTKKCDIRSLQEKIKADIEKDDAETLSQIEAFVKKPLEVVPQEPIKNMEKDDVETLSQIEAFIKKPLDINNSKVRRSVRKDQTLSDQEIIRTDDVNQSFSLVETKSSKVRRQPKRDMAIDEIKVAVTSHRRSMNVAETSIIEALDESRRKSRRVRTINNNVASLSSTKGKTAKEQKPTESEPETAARVSRRNNVKKESNRVSASITNSGNVRKNETRIFMETIHDELPSSSKCFKNDLNSNKNTVDDSNVISPVETDAASVSSVKRRRTSRLRSTESAGKSSSKSDECEPVPKKKLKVGNKIVETKKSTSEDSDVTNETSTPSKKRANSRLKLDTDVSVSTPKRNNKPVSDETLLSSAERSKRKQRPKVVFTMLDNPQLESYIKHLGGSVVDGVDACTVLVTGEVKRSQKLLAAVAQGKPICSPSWIQASKKSNEFLDPWDFILVDKEAESKWNFSLRESLDRANCEKLLTNYSFQLIVSKAADVLKSAIEASGGKCLTRNPGKNFEGHFVVVSSPEHKAKYLKLKKQNPNITIVEPEAIFDGVLRQELRFAQHLIP